MIRPAPVRTPDDDVFWSWTARRELRLQCCARCGRFRYPPGPCCPHCLDTTASWEAVGGNATLISWCRFHRQYFPSMPAPYVVVSVALEEGPLMVGNLLAGETETADTAGLRAGDPLRLAFADHQLEDGRAIVLPQWTPRSGGGEA